MQVNPNSDDNHNALLTNQDNSLGEEIWKLMTESKLDDIKKIMIDACGYCDYDLEKFFKEFLGIFERKLRLLMQACEENSNPQRNFNPKMNFLLNSYKIFELLEMKEFKNFLQRDKNSKDLEKIQQLNLEILENLVVEKKCLKENSSEAFEILKNSIDNKILTTMPIWKFQKFSDLYFLIARNFYENHEYYKAFEILNKIKILYKFPEKQELNFTFKHFNNTSKESNADDESFTKILNLISKCSNKLQKSKSVKTISKSDSESNVNKPSLRDNQIVTSDSEKNLTFKNKISSNLKLKSPSSKDKFKLPEIPKLSIRKNLGNITDTNGRHLEEITYPKLNKSFTSNTIQLNSKKSSMKKKASSLNEFNTRIEKKLINTDKDLIETEDHIHIHKHIRSVTCEGKKSGNEDEISSSRDLVKSKLKYILNKSNSREKIFNNNTALTKDIKNYNPDPEELYNNVSDKKLRTCKTIQDEHDDRQYDSFKSRAEDKELKDARNFNKRRNIPKPFKHSSILIKKKPTFPLVNDSNIQFHNLNSNLSNPIVKYDFSKDRAKYHRSDADTKIEFTSDKFLTKKNRNLSANLNLNNISLIKNLNLDFSYESIKNFKEKSHDKKSNCGRKIKMKISTSNMMKDKSKENEIVDREEFTKGRRGRRFSQSRDGNSINSEDFKLKNDPRHLKRNIHAHAHADAHGIEDNVKIYSEKIIPNIGKDLSGVNENRSSGYFKNFNHNQINFPIENFKTLPLKISKDLAKKFPTKSHLTSNKKLDNAGNSSYSNLKIESFSDSHLDFEGFINFISQELAKEKMSLIFFQTIDRKIHIVYFKVLSIIKAKVKVNSAESIEDVPRISCEIYYEMFSRKNSLIKRKIEIPIDEGVYIAKAKEFREYICKIKCGISLLKWSYVLPFIETYYETKIKSEFSYSVEESDTSLANLIYEKKFKQNSNDLNSDSKTRTLILAKLISLHVISKYEGKRSAHKTDFNTMLNECLEYAIRNQSIFNRKENKNISRYEFRRILEIIHKKDEEFLPDK